MQQKYFFTRPAMLHREIGTNIFGQTGPLALRSKHLHSLSRYFPNIRPWPVNYSTIEHSQSIYLWNSANQTGKVTSNLVNVVFVPSNYFIRIVPVSYQLAEQTKILFKEHFVMKWTCHYLCFTPKWTTKILFFVTWP